MHGSGRSAYLDDGMRGFITKFARKNHWRVSAWIDLDDLVQDGLMCFAKCRHRYVDVLRSLPERPATADHRRIMMAMVMTAYARHIHGLASDRTERVDECCFADAGAPDKDFGDAIARTVAAPPGPESLVEVLAGAPREVAELLRILAGDAHAAAMFVRDGLGRRETMAQHVRRLDAGGGASEPMRSRARRQTEPLRWVRVRGAAICYGGSTRVRMGRRALRETTNELYCRLLGLDPRKHDVRGMVRDYLS